MPPKSERKTKKKKEPEQLDPAELKAKITEVEVELREARDDLVNLQSEQAKTVGLDVPTTKALVADEIDELEETIEQLEEVLAQLKEIHPIAS